MGVIKKILYRENILGKPRHRNFFLDMEENIHIHYRDLRIELSRAEFEDIASIFAKQSKELLDIIEQKNYQDGKLANANQDDVRIWTESRLNNEVKYHPTRFSLEECTDGYHFHYRNYKLLIDADEFREIVRLFRTLDIDRPYASTYQDVSDLLEANDVDFLLDTGNVPGEVLAIAVGAYHMPKVRDVFKSINFTQEEHGAVRHYLGEKLKVVARPDRTMKAQDYRRIRGASEVQRLADYLAREGAAMNTNDLNSLKCQVIDLYSALKAGQKLSVETDVQLWLYEPRNQQIVFPYSSTARSGKVDAEAMYRGWSGMLNRVQLGFIKPTKDKFPAAAQTALYDKVIEAIRREVSAFAAVDRVYIMGSAVRGDMGRYRAPFIHGKWAKLGSDVDILVEINPAREADVPAHWELVNPESSNKCAVYHVAEVPIEGGAGEWAVRHPNIEFIQHLIDAYVHFPSHGYVEEKEAFLKKFSAKVIYERAQDGIVSRGGEEARVVDQVTKAYGLSSVMVEKMKVSTENAIFKVFSDLPDAVLKLFKVSGNYPRTRVAEHAAYEAALIAALKARGIHTPGIMPTKGGEPVAIEGHPALLFERIPGLVQQKPEYPMAIICPELALMHQVQIDRSLGIEAGFSFDDVCMMWLPQFTIYANAAAQTFAHSPEIVRMFAALSPIVDRYNPGPVRAAMYERSPAVHCHGDVTPKNVIVVGETANVFDFNNAFFGPRMTDVIDGAYEYSLAEKYIDLADFKRFDAFIDQYAQTSPLTAGELEDRKKWTELIGLIKFTKEARVLTDKPAEALRKRRALAVAEFVLSQQG
jgi:Ser/Thr protein kinase RdoA (MazF antagonist)/predicted nucleotidyltransferase